MKTTHLPISLAAALGLLGARGAAAAVFPATLVALEGDTALLGAEGLPVGNLSYPVVTSTGKLGFTGYLWTGDLTIDGFVWFDGAIVWRGSWEQPPVLGASTRGFDDAGGWFVRGDLDGPVLWSHRGLLVRQDDWIEWNGVPYQVRQLAEGAMSSAGAAYWRAEVRDADGPSHWVVLKSATATGGDVEFDLAPDARFGGYPLAGWVYEFAISRQRKHGVYSLLLEVDGDERSAVVADGSILALAGRPTGGLPGELWGGVGPVAVNNGGAVAFAAVTSAAGDPWVLAHAVPGKPAGSGGARIVLRAGDCVGTQGDAEPCLTLNTSDEARSVAVSEAGALAHIWIEDFAHGGDEHLFYSCSPAAARAATLLLSRFDSVDLDGDGYGDAVIDRVGLPGEQVVAFGDGVLYVGAEFTSVSGPLEAILELELPACPDQMSR